MAIQCPNCGCKHLPAKKTTTHEFTFRGRKITIVRRRRVCRHCGTATFTQERNEEDIIRPKDDRKITPADDSDLENPFL